MHFLIIKCKRNKAISIKSLIFTRFPLIFLMLISDHCSKFLSFSYLFTLTLHLALALIIARNIWAIHYKTLYNTAGLGYYDVFRIIVWHTDLLVYAFDQAVFYDEFWGFYNIALIHFWGVPCPFLFAKFIQILYY